MLGSSQTPRDKGYLPPQSHQSSSTISTSRPSLDRDASATNLHPPGVGSGSGANGGRSLGASAVSFGPRGSSLNPSIGPGSFSSELRSQMTSSRAGSRADVYGGGGDNRLDMGEVSVSAAEQTLNALRDQLNREMKIKEGSENMLEALNSKKAKQTKEQRARVEAELNTSNQKIKELRNRIADAQRVKVVSPTTPTRTRTADPIYSTGGIRSPHSVPRSAAGSDMDDVVEQSPTFALAEILQALEAEGMGPEYYVSRGNILVDLLRRHPTLKYDLVWPIFGLRMQVMLCSEAREVVAAGYRVVRYAISDVASLKKIRELNTDYLVTT